MVFSAWCRTVFPGLSTGISLYVHSPGTSVGTSVGTDSWTTIHIKANSLDEIITQLPSRFIHCVVFHTPTLMKDLKKFPHSRFRFGTIVIDIREVKRKHQFRLRKSLEDALYRQVQKDGEYAYYQSKIGHAPYYLGQPILNRFTVIKSYTSGCGSDGVYLVRDEIGIHMVVKRCSTEKTYARELESLQLTRDWTHSPTLYHAYPKERILVVEWCGEEMRHAKPKHKRKAVPIIRQLVDTLYRTYGIYHNDIRWKNITRHGDKIMLIDWGMSGKELKERDPSKILSPSQRKG